MIGCIIGIMLIAGMILFEFLLVKECMGILSTIGVFIIVLVSLSLIFNYIVDTPSAMDVYKGKTELKITYEGATPTDSVVIYKKYK